MGASLEAACWGGIAELEPLVRVWLSRRCRDGSELDDVVQETLLRAARYRLRGHAPRRLEPWLLRIASNALHDRARREGRARVRAEGEQLLEELAAPDSVHECVGDAGAERWTLGRHVVTKDTALAVLDVALRRLRSDERALLCSFYSGARRCGAAARACGQPEERAKLRLFRARRRLGRELERRLAGAAALEAALAEGA